MLGTLVVVPGTAIITIKAESKHTIVGIDTNKPVRWTKFKSDTIQKKILIEKFRAAAKVTKYTDGSPVFYYKSKRLYYQSPLA